MNRDFIGALLQLNAEKNIPREQLVHAVSDAIQSAYRRVSPGNENVWVDVDPEYRPHPRLSRQPGRRRGRRPDDRVHRRRGQEVQA